MRSHHVGHSVLRVGLFLVVGAMVGLNVYVWNSRYVLHDELPMPFGFGFAVVMSGSMEPTLMVDDLVVIGQVSGIYEVAVGDVVVYQRGGELVIHRVISMQDNSVITQGDANNVADNPVAIEDVKGKMVSSIGGVGAAMRVVQSPLATILLVAVVIVIIEAIARLDAAKKREEVRELHEQIAELKAARDANDRARLAAAADADGVDVNFAGGEGVVGTANCADDLSGVRVVGCVDGAGDTAYSTDEDNTDAMLGTDTTAEMALNSACDFDAEGGAGNVA